MLTEDGCQPAAYCSPFRVRAFGSDPVITPCAANSAIAAPIPDPTMTFANARSRRAPPAAKSLRQLSIIGAKGERSPANLMRLVGVRTNGKIGRASCRERVCQYG